ncbi:uncharacterized protein LOC112048181 isoform X2 [Bicyclus anynana]|nr:uncharacterized protein LOC112048181 isoform X2 [Bicyclus anynana]XP_052740331.1 uncharacterized protein LOC112048181 isoform X2 [Bicyclus anynana]XP_052740332.1 uncharacterized protein LOC112048181 isoform X2 [Bicyclus anynana]
MDESKETNQDNRDFTLVNKQPVQDNRHCLGNDWESTCGPSNESLIIRASTSRAPHIRTMTTNKTITASLFNSIYYEGINGPSSSAYPYNTSSTEQDLTRSTDEHQQLLNYEDYKSASVCLKDAIQHCPDKVTLDAMKSYYYMKLKMDTVNDAKDGNNNCKLTSGYICLAMCDIALDYITDNAGEVVKKDCNVDDGKDEGISSVQDMQHLVLSWLENKTQGRMSLHNYATDVSINEIKYIKENSLRMLARIEQALEIARGYLQNEVIETKDVYAMKLCHYYSRKLLLADFKAGVFPFHLGAIDCLRKANEIIHLADGDARQEVAHKLELAIKNNDKFVNLIKRVHCEQGQRYVQSNEIYKAIEEYTDALTLDNNCTEVLNERAKCYTEVDDYESAIKDYEKLFTITKNEKLRQSVQDSIVILKNKKTLTQNQKVKRANEDISEIKVLYSKGRRLYFFENQYQEALDYFQQVLEVDPSHSGALLLTDLIVRLKSTIEQGNDAFTNGQWQDALDKFNEALTIDKNNRNLNVNLYSKKAKMYFNLKQIHQAIEAYTDALKLDDKCLNALRGRAECYTKVENYKAAIDDYEKILSFHKSEYITEWALSSIHTLKIKIDYREKIRLAESLVESQKTVELEQALYLAEECLQFDRSDIKALCVKGLCLYYKDQYQQAIDQFQQVLHVESSHSMALSETKKITLLKNTIAKGNNSFTAGNWQDALVHFNEVIKIDDGNLNLKIKMHCKNAEIYLKLNSIYKAIEEYTSALEFDKFCVEALRNRAECYLNVGDHRNSIRDYSKICGSEADEETKQLANNAILKVRNTISLRDKCNRAENLLKSQKTDEIEEALKIAEECLKFDSSDIKALCVKGSCLYYKNQYEQALDQFQKVVHLKPSHLEALTEMKKNTLLKRTIEQGNDSFCKGLLQDALDTFNTALVLGKDNINLIINLNCKKATIHIKLKEMQEAVEAYTAVLKLDETCLEALRGRAECYTKIEKYGDAIEDWERILSPRIKGEQMKYWARKSIKNLNKKIAYKNKIEQAENFIKNKKIIQAMKLAEECLQFDKSDVKALCVKGSCLYYKNDLEQALNQFNKVLLLEPLHSTALKESKKITDLKRTIEQGENSMKEHRWQDALIKFNEAFTITKDNDNVDVKVNLYYKKASVYSKLKQTQRAIDECTNAILLQPNFVKAIKKRANCYTDAKQFEDALKDYEKLYTLEKSVQNLVFIQNTQSILNGQKLSQQKVQDGNRFYRNNKFREALEMYKEAIELYPHNAYYYGNTFSCYIKLSMLSEALIDAKKAVELDIHSSKGVGGVAKCYIALGDLSGAERAIVKASEAGEDCMEERRALQTLQRLHAQAHKHIEERDYQRAVSCMNQCLEYSPFSSKMKLIKAECLAMLGKIKQAEDIADECMRCDPSDIDARFVMGLGIYYNEKLYEAKKCFKDILLLSPEHKKAMAAYKKVKLLIQKKEQVVEQMNMCRWQKTLQLCDEALAIDTTHVKTNARLHFDKATAYSKLKQTHSAVDACTAALDLDQNYLAALTLRAKCFTLLQDYESAVDDYERLYKLQPSDEFKTLLDDAKRLRSTKSECQNYYQILDVAKTASEDEIKKAYRKLALVHHPDRHSGRSLHERKTQERRFKLVLEAYNVLSDKLKRLKYDSRGFFDFDPS